MVLNSHKMLIVIVADFDWSLWFESIYKRFVTLSENPVEVIFSTKKKNHNSYDKERSVRISYLYKHVFCYIFNIDLVRSCQSVKLMVEIKL